MRVKPLTPRTFSMLCAGRSPFAVGGKIGERDVRNFLWYHSPWYCDSRLWGHRLIKWWVLRKLRRNLSPWWCRWLGLTPPVYRYVATLALITAEIDAIVEEAFADAPPKSARPSRAIACSEAYFIHEFTTGYGWTPERTSNTPIAQLMQLHRCLMAYRGEEVSDAGEDRIMAEHLLRKNIEAAEKRAKHG